jgi:hypothetical protein
MKSSAFARIAKYALPTHECFSKTVNDYLLSSILSCFGRVLTFPTSGYIPDCGNSGLIRKVIGLATVAPFFSSSWGFDTENRHHEGATGFYRHIGLDYGCPGMEASEAGLARHSRWTLIMLTQSFSPLRAFQISFDRMSYCLPSYWVFHPTVSISELSHPLSWGNPLRPSRGLATRSWQTILTRVFWQRFARVDLRASTTSRGSSTFHQR